jgi:hypothetical protein
MGILKKILNLPCSYQVVFSLERQVRESLRLLYHGSYVLPSSLELILLHFVWRGQITVPFAIQSLF